MDFSACAQCGLEIESKGIHFRGQVFCRDECCEEYVTLMEAKGEPELAELEKDDLDPEDLGEDLGYRNGDGDKELLDDDEEDFEIAPGDF